MGATPREETRASLEGSSEARRGDQSALTLQKETSELGRIETGSLVVFLLAERAPSEGPRPGAESKIDQATR